MTVKPQILTPRAKFLEKDGTPSVPWWRFFDSLQGLAGTLLNPLTVKPNAILSAGTLTTGGQIASPDLPPESLIGNPGTVAGQPAVVTIDNSLALNNGALGVADLPAKTLSGNAGPGPAQPGPITPVLPLMLNPNGTLSIQVIPGTTTLDDLEEYVYTLPNLSGPVAKLQRDVTELETLVALNRGTAGGSSGGSGGTTAIYAPLVNGDLPGPTAIADPFGQFIMVPIT